MFQVPTVIGLKSVIRFARDNSFMPSYLRISKVNAQSSRANSLSKIQCDNDASQNPLSVASHALVSIDLYPMRHAQLMP